MSGFTSKKAFGKIVLSSLFLLCSSIISVGSATAQNNQVQEKAPATSNQKNNASNDIYQKNKLARCDIFSGDMKLLCRQQIMDGPIQGSVQQGGTLYEPAVLETILLVPEE